MYPFFSLSFSFLLVLPHIDLMYPYSPIFAITLVPVFHCTDNYEKEII
jgi:hypothetical protein